MVEISANLVKELRDVTGAGMMDCKKALQNAGGNVEEAVDFLRKAGIAKAEKKAGRSVKEGLITSIDGAGKGVMVEVLCETDFVSKGDTFRDYIAQAVDHVLAMGGDGDVSAAAAEAEKDALTTLIGTIGENMQLRRAVRWETPGKIVSYLHMGGRIGVMIDAVGDDNEELLRDVCMHIAAFRPMYVTPDEIPAAAIDKEKEIAAAQIGDKPKEMLDKIIGGKINKWFSESCLMKQPWLRDDKTSLEKVSPKLQIRRFVRWEVGEEL